MIKDKIWCQICGRTLGYIVISKKQPMGFYCEKCNELLNIEVQKLADWIDDDILKYYQEGV